MTLDAARSPEHVRRDRTELDPADLLLRKQPIVYAIGPIAVQVPGDHVLDFEQYKGRHHRRTGLL